MPKVTIVQPLTLTNDTTGATYFYPVGVHDMSEEDANHWYTRAHSDDPLPVVPKAGTPEYGNYMMAAERRRQILNMTIEQEAQAAAAKVRADAQLTISDQELEFHEQEMEERHKEETAAAENDAVRSGRRVVPPAAPASRRPLAGSVGNNTVETPTAAPASQPIQQRPNVPPAPPKPAAA